MGAVYPVTTNGDREYLALLFPIYYCCFVDWYIAKTSCSMNKTTSGARYNHSIVFYIKISITERCPEENKS